MTTPTTGAAELPKQSIREQIAAEVATQPAAQVEFLARWLCARDRINPDRVLDDEPVKLAWHREDLTAARLLKELAALREAIGAGGVSGPLMGGYSAGDMAAQGAEQFRAGQAAMLAAVEPVGYMRPDELQKAALGCYLCSVYNERDKHSDMVPVYTRPPPVAPAQPDTEVEQLRREIAGLRAALEFIAGIPEHHAGSTVNEYHMRVKARGALAGTAPVSQEYAELPNFDELERVIYPHAAGTQHESVYKAMRAFADATHTLRTEGKPCA